MKTEANIPLFAIVLAGLSIYNFCTFNFHDGILYGALSFFDYLLTNKENYIQELEERINSQ